LATSKDGCTGGNSEEAARKQKPDHLAQRIAYRRRKETEADRARWREAPRRLCGVE
jgi:hypothetical protein